MTGNFPILSSHAAVLAQDRILCFGGVTRNHERPIVNDLFECNIPQREWTKPQVTGFELKATYGHTAVFIEREGWMVILQEKEPKRLGVYVIDVDDYHSFQLNTKGTPPPSRYYHSSCYSSSKLYVLGGTLMPYLQLSSEFFMLDFSKRKLTPRWESLRPIAFGRRNASMFAVDGRVFVLGGHSQENKGMQMLLYDTEAKSWTNEIVSKGMPEEGELRYHAATQASSKTVYVISSLAREKDTFFEINISN